MAVMRHRPHVTEAMVHAAEAHDLTHGENLIERLQGLSTIALGILADAKAARQYGAAIAGVREMGRIVELVAKLTGQLDEGTRVNVLVAQQQERVGEQTLMLERLTVEERVELRRLISKAEGAATDTIPTQSRDLAMISST
jgi:hypothetical protein